jgi:septin family protein
MLDVTAMRKLHKKVNLVPVIAKADSLTSSELQRLKARVLAELKQYDIQVHFNPIQSKFIIKSFDASKRQ